MLQYTVVSLGNVTQLGTGHASTHTALNLFAVSDVQELSALVHSLVITLASDMQRVKTALEKIAESQITASMVSADSGTVTHICSI